MSQLLKIASAFNYLSLAIFVFKPEWTSVSIVASSCVLLACVAHLEHQKQMKDDGVGAQLKDLKSKVELLMISKGFGR